MRAIFLALAASLIVWPTLSQAQVTRLLVVGDSWAEEQWEDGSHARVFAQHGLSAIGIYGDSTTESGSTAFDWKQASYLQRVDAALQTHPDVDTVQLTVGGNDFLDVWHTSMTAGEIETLTNAILFDLHLIIDYVLASDADIEILLSLYDYPNFRDTLGGLGGWFACEPRWQGMGGPTPLELNGVAIDLVESIASLAASDARVHYVDHFGLMQNFYGWPDDGIPPGSITPPGLIDEPSPYDAMRRHFFGLAVDCFHLRPEGYDVIVENMIDRFFGYRFETGAEISLDVPVAVYDGSAHAVIASTQPAGLTVDLSYDGHTAPPIDAGSYAVVAQVNQGSWSGQATATLTIEAASQTIEFSAPSSVYDSEPPITLNATATSGLAVAFDLISGPATLSGNVLTLTGAVGTIVVEASQPGDNNWQSAETVERTIEVVEFTDELFEDQFELAF